MCVCVCLWLCVCECVFVNVCEPQKFSYKYIFKLIMDSIEEYACSWAKQEDVELDIGNRPL